ncbi:MAG: hypothetical protein PHC88_14100 [Terrimicrobiaceae bacterium]|nr:hypothetical protein [Terrimicrobiaceae bacterium]
MKIHAILVLALVAITQPVVHAAPAPPNRGEWEAALAARQQRAELLRDEIKALDAGIERRIDSIAEALRAIGDSKDSRTKVARMKEQTIDALSRNIGYFQSRRATLLEELRRPTWQLTADQMREGIAFFDARIEKRIAQILAVQKSLPTHKDYERYKVTGSTWVGPTYAVNEDHRQNQRVTAVTDSQRKRVVEGLQKSISRIEQQNRTLKARGAPAAGEIAKNDALLAERRQQLASALSATGTPTREVGLNEALDLDKALQTALAELRKDFTTLFARYSAYLQALSAVNSTRKALDAVKTKSS